MTTKRELEARITAMAQTWDSQFAELHSRLSVAEQQVEYVLAVLDGAEITVDGADPKRDERNARRRAAYAAKKAK